MAQTYIKFKVAVCWRQQRLFTIYIAVSVRLVCTRRTAQVAQAQHNIFEPSIVMYARSCASRLPHHTTGRVRDSPNHPGIRPWGLLTSFTRPFRASIRIFGRLLDVCDYVVQIFLNGTIVLQSGDNFTSEARLRNVA